MYPHPIPRKGPRGSPGGPVPYRSRSHEVHQASATVPHLLTNTASARTFLFPRNALLLLLDGNVRAPLLSKGARKNNTKSLNLANVADTWQEGKQEVSECTVVGDCAEILQGCQASVP